MKTRFTLIIAFLLSVSALAGCSNQSDKQEGASVHSAAPAVSVVHAREKTVSLEFSQNKTAQGEVEISVYLNNPNQERLSSVRAWLAFNPRHLEGLSLSTDDSDFPLPAPGENAFKNQEGILMIARGAEGYADQKRLLVAKAIFKPLKEGAIMLDAYNYQPDSAEGNVSANVVLNGASYNVLKSPQVPALIIQNKLSQ